MIIPSFPVLFSFPIKFTHGSVKNFLSNRIPVKLHVIFTNLFINIINTLLWLAVVRLPKFPILFECYYFEALKTI